MHGVERKAELSAVVGDALISMHNLLELKLVALVAGFGLAYVVEGKAAEFLEAVSMFLLGSPAALEEAGKVLNVLVRQPDIAKDAEHTRELAMLALRRLSRVFTPMSEWSTSCTCCWMRGSWAS